MPFPRIGTVEPAAALKNDNKGLSDQLILEFFIFEISILSGLLLRNEKTAIFRREISKKREPNKTRQKTFEN